MATFLLPIGNAWAEPFQITPTVQENWQAYLSKITSTNSGAFAVSVDGYGSYFIYCDSTWSCSSVTLALKECRARSDMDCKIMAKGKDLAFDFEVVQLTEQIGDDHPIKQHLLDGAALKEKIVGNTTRGLYFNNLKWTEYYAPDGAIHGRDDAHGDYQASYKIDGDKLCYDYPGESSDWCARLSLTGDRLEFLNEDGEHELGMINTVLIPGNAIQ
jgi:hypothetical protein